VAVVTVISMLACLVLLAIAARRKVMSDDNTTGHAWDGDITELNNPLPRWWMWLFIATVVFSLAYLFLYPGAGSRAGTLGWSSAGQYAAEQKAAREAMASVYAGYAHASAEALIKDPAAMGIGERLFLNNCAACHGSDGRGSRGFPNLTDDDWLYGGDAPTIEATISGGRVGQMPSMAAAVGGEREQREVAHYVMSLSGSPHDSIAAAGGKKLFGQCAACHGIGGKGNPALGAPNLSDAVWLHGWGEKAIMTTIANGRTNVMPAHKERLTPEQIHVLAAYVMSLSRSRTTATP
jgi:cytochrome c oxidase cbb3-type subunit 3